MAVADEQLRKLAELKLRWRQTDDEIAVHFGVTPRTIQRWLHSSEYVASAQAYRVDRREEMRQRVAGLGDEVIDTMHALMTSARSELVRYNAAKSLGEWLGLHELDTTPKGNDKAELEELLAIAAKTSIIPQFLPPPGPGGSLPLLSTAIVEEGEWRELEEKEPNENGTAT